MLSFVTQATEKTRKLKEARDYSFLFDDSPLPDAKIANREGPSSSKLGEMITWILSLVGMCPQNWFNGIEFLDFIM